MVQSLQPPVLEVGEDGQETPGVAVLRVQFQRCPQAGPGLVPFVLLEIDAGQFRMGRRVAGPQANGALQFPLGIGPTLLLGQGHAEQKGGLAVGRLLLQNLPEERLGLLVSLCLQLGSTAGKQIIRAGRQAGRSQK